MFVRVWILILSILTLVCCQSLPQPCGFEEACTCDHQHIKCDCNEKGRENIILNNFLDVRNPVSILVQGCIDVEIRFGTFWYMNIQNLEFRNITNLRISSFATSKNAHISNLIFEDISDLEVAVFALTGIDSTETIQLRNVTSKNFHELAIVGIGIDLFLIENSRMNIQPFSILLAEIKDLIIRSSYFEHISNTSFMVQSAETVAFHNTEFSSTEPRSFIILGTKTLKVTKCLFDNLTHGFLYGDVSEFLFLRNKIGTTETDAFLHLSVNDSAEFKFNTFKYLEENSIFPHPDNTVSSTLNSIEFEGNRFHCDCRLSWIFNNPKVYSSVIQSSYCHNYKNIRLVQILPLMQGNQTCNFSGYEQMKPIDFDQLESSAQEGESLTSAAASNWKIFMDCSLCVIWSMFTFMAYVHRL